jgi:hypothetical protein
MRRSLRCESGLQRLLGMLTTWAYRPREWLGVTEKTARDLDCGDDLLTLCIFGTHDIDSCEKRRDHRKQARFYNVSAWADAPTKAKTNCAWVTDVRVKHAVWSEITVGIEGVGIRVVLGIVQDSPNKQVSSMINAYESVYTDQSAPNTRAPFGMR